MQRAIPPSSTPMRLKAEQRLRHAADFKKIRLQGRCFHFSAFMFQILQRPMRTDTLEQRRFAVIASRRFGNAVWRNRAKRRFREIFRLNQAALPPGCDGVFLVRAGFKNTTFDELQRHFLDACSKIKKISQPHRV